MRPVRLRFCLAALLALSISALGVAQPSQEKLLENLRFRTVGPAVFGGRLVDLDIHPSDPFTIYATAASGGLFKSVNYGTTWKPIFDDYPVNSLGCLTIAPSDPKIIWLGTGENNSQRSAHYGDGVYKSTDAGETWTNMGLNDSRRVGRIVVHPTNPDIVYVATMGYLYKPGGDKGIYKTTDGGRTWNQVLKGDNDTTGFIDVAMDPRDPNVLYAASHDRLRRPWNIRENGPGAAIYKTTDAGATWNKLGGGLPSGDSIGRIGLAIYPKNGDIIYAFVDNKGPGGEVYRSNDAGATWTKQNETRLGGGTYYSQIFVDPNNPDVVYSPNVQLMRSEDGGKTFRRVDRMAHVDWHPMIINPENSRHVIAASDGGLYITYDYFDTLEFVSNLPLAQFYAIGADEAVPYNVFGGTQDNGSWHGPSRTRNSGGIFNQHWVNLIGGDGFYTQADPTDPNTLYSSSQFGAIQRIDLPSRSSRSIRPREQGQRANWMSPFQLSPHNPQVLYWGANRLWRSMNRGDSWRAISPDLTTNDAEKIRGNVPHCTITTVEESRITPGLIWVGTDDGNVWVTRDGGVNWTQLNEKLESAGAPKLYWVSRVHASPHDEGTAFVTYTGFREDDWKPYLFKTTDFGATWTRMEGLPDEQLCVIRQDAINPNMLVVGTEVSSHISLDGGKTWTRMNRGIPTNPVQDLTIQERESDLILGTHGRGIFIADVTPYRQLSDAVLAKPTHLFNPTRALAYVFIPDMFEPFNGHKRYAAPNPEFGAALWYYVKEDLEEAPRIEILDIGGNVLATFTGEKTAGIHKAQWNLRSRGGGNQPVGGGRYLVRLTSGNDTQTAILVVEDWQRAPGSGRPGADALPDDGVSAAAR